MRRTDAVKSLLVCYGILNAALYASLLPLWEGFDEPFHYSYVEHMAELRSLPQLGKAHLSREVWESLHLAPASEAVRQHLPWVKTFGEYFRSPPDERARVRTALNGLHSSFPSGGAGWSDAANYEAQHPPLAYALLAPAYRLLSPLSLPTRVRTLRLICGILAVCLTAGATFSLATGLGVSGRAQMPLVFITLSSQMFYATTAHVANDWLAVPLVLVVVDRCVALQRQPSVLNMALAMGALVCGLLTKAYLLALVPAVAVAFAGIAISGRASRGAIALVCAVGAACCVPWYARNIALYGSLAGMQEASGGVKPLDLLRTARRLPWGHALLRSLFEGLWSGNNSFTAFSSGTLWLVSAGLGFGCVVYVVGIARRGWRIPAAEQVVLGCIALYGAALMYYVVLSYQVSSGAIVSSCPWYTAPLAPLVLALLFRGFERMPLAEKVVVPWLVWLSAYVILATYWAKLVPLYGGFLEDRTTLAALFRWYTGSTDAIVFNLRTTALVGPGAIAAMLAGVTIAVPALAVAVTDVRHLWRSGSKRL